METDLYFELALKTSLLSEEFYRRLNRWKSNGHYETNRTAYTDVAERYRQAVEEQIAYLRALDPSPEIEQTLNTVLEHRDQFYKDLELVQLDLSAALQGH
jgi:hypothetical protein